MQITRELQNTLAEHPMQTWEWGEARKKMGIQVEKIIDDNAIFQFTIHQIPHTPFKIGYLPRSVLPSRAVVQTLYDFGRKHNLIFIKIEPYVSNSERFEFDDSIFTIVPSSHPLFPEWTQVLELFPTEEVLLKSFRPKTRYNIRLAEKKGVQIREMNSTEGFSIFSKLYFETCSRQHYRGHTPAYHSTIWNALRHSQATLLVAFFNNQPLAAYELLHFKNVWYYIYGGSSVEHREVMATNLLMWEAIKLAKKNGAHRFDMWGSLPPHYTLNHPWAGFTRFKEGYHTNYVHLQPSKDLVIHTLIYPIYGAIHAIREKLL